MLPRLRLAKIYYTRMLSYSASSCSLLSCPGQVVVVTLDAASACRFLWLQRVAVAATASASVELKLKADSASKLGASDCNTHGEYGRDGGETEQGQLARSLKCAQIGLKCFWLKGL